MIRIPPRLYREGQEYNLRPGDQLIYDKNNGAMSIRDKEGAMISFEVDEGSQPVNRHFIGKGWSSHMASALFRLIAVSYGLKGEAERVEGSLETLQTYTLIR